MRATALVSTILLATELATLCQSFTINPPKTARVSSIVCPSAPADSDFEIPRAVKDKQTVDPNVYNIPLDQAAELWTASVQESNNADRKAGVPYMDSKSKDYFVDDIVSVEVSRDGGLGLELLELAGGRADGIGITIVSGVTKGGNAEKAGIIPGDSIAAVSVYETEMSDVEGSFGLIEETKSRVRDCECKDFDNTIDALANFPGDDAESVFLDIKRIRRWPKVQVQVEYPPSQCAEGVNNVKKIELFAGENLKRALQNRGIILSDPGSPKCDYCGSNACYVSIYRGKSLLNPMGTTEKKLMARNQDCRLSCKTTVGYNMQEGDVRMRINLCQWQE
uniref:PDZ domain-containing protein n=1 Tax=Helicotheca tamesis TaxID=374047 RepID=A0A7S2MVP6_9STRA|mmetsp:Transcript_4239/g.5769  ORF Transcript_4239/g.5769 Transcript_4239/m.5769 type:complete len:336 (+) Transcript_4239:146-1153(+)